MPFIADRRLEDLLDPEAGMRCSRRIAQAGVDWLVANTKKRTPVDISPYRDKPARPPGTARNSVHATDVDRRRGVVGPVYEGRARTEDPIFPHIEWTTKPHIIRPRADRNPASVVETRRPRGTVQDGRAALSWRDATGRRFAKEVHHPGTRGQHPFAYGAAETERQLVPLSRPAVALFARELVPPRTGRVRGLERFR